MELFSGCGLDKYPPAALDKRKGPAPVHLFLVHHHHYLLFQFYYRNLHLPFQIFQPLPSLLYILQFHLLYILDYYYYPPRLDVYFSCQHFVRPADYLVSLLRSQLSAPPPQEKDSDADDLLLWSRSIDLVIPCPSFRQSNCSRDAVPSYFFLLFHDDDNVAAARIRHHRNPKHHTHVSTSDFRNEHPNKIHRVSRLGSKLVNRTPLSSSTRLRPWRLPR
mmetsp:Transcript_12886/g.18941  ORF Transcript_12886/g.18941 Transcript_12886/m.18941 type:complete len:219 (-) Transcript_12886:472-1128(-)